VHSTIPEASREPRSKRRQSLYLPKRAISGMTEAGDVAQSAATRAEAAQRTAPFYDVLRMASWPATITSSRGTIASTPAQEAQSPARLSPEIERLGSMHRIHSGGAQCPWCVLALPACWFYGTNPSTLK